MTSFLFDQFGMAVQAGTFVLHSTFIMLSLQLHRVLSFSKLVLDV